MSLFPIAFVLIVNAPGRGFSGSERIAGMAFRRDLCRRRHLTMRAATIARTVTLKITATAIPACTPVELAVFSEFLVVAGLGEGKRELLDVVDGDAVDAILEDNEDVVDE